MAWGKVPKHFLRDFSRGCCRFAKFPGRRCRSLIEKSLIDLQALRYVSHLDLTSLNKCSAEKLYFYLVLKLSREIKLLTSSRSWKVLYNTRSLSLLKVFKENGFGFSSIWTSQMIINGVDRDYEFKTYSSIQELQCLGYLRVTSTSSTPPKVVLLNNIL